MAETTTAPAAPADQQPARKSPVKPIVGLWLLITIALEVFALFVPAHLMGVEASKAMVDIENSVTLFSVAAAPVAALVWAIALYSLLRWRYGGGKQPPPEDGPPLRGHTPIQIIWVMVSSVLCVFLFIWGLVEMQAEGASAGVIGAAPPGTLTVDVTGQQWLWTFTYPGARNYTSNVLYLPVSKPVIFDVTSSDVVHSFWLVQMGVKIDANPGQITRIGVTPDRLGTYTVRCAELCGLYHAYMVAQVKVVPDALFARWMHSDGALHITSTAAWHGHTPPLARAQALGRAGKQEG